MSPSDRLRRFAAPVVVFALLGAIGFAVTRHRPPSTTARPGDPSASRHAAGSTTTSSPYWTVPQTSAAPGTPQVAMDAVQWSDVAYPGHCGPAPQGRAQGGAQGGGQGGGQGGTQNGASSGSAPPAPDDLSPTTTASVSTGFTVDQVSYAQPAPSVELAVVLVQCGSGEEPAGLYVFHGATSATQPDLVQTLVPESQDVFAGAFSVQGPDVAIQVVSGSPGKTGACCAGLTYELQWVWSKNSYQPAS